MTIAESGTAGRAGDPPTRTPGLPDPGSDGTPNTAGGGIDRLNAFDGLFLRAEHLNRIQDYAEELATAIGIAGGPGVVEGYQVSIESGELQVTAGLAIDSWGRPLRSDRAVSLPFQNPTPGQDTFYWVEVSRAAWGYGETPVQGLLCDDPCSDGTTNQQYTAAGVRIDLVPDSASQLDAQLPSRRRNWLASRLFEEERRAQSPWIADPSSLPVDWEPPSVPATRPNAVRLAVVIPTSGGPADWEVDVWTARRDRGAPPPQRYWQGRLRMRPWDVFIAQILQFQDQLRDLTSSTVVPGAELEALKLQLNKIAAHAGQQHGVTKAQLEQEILTLASQVGTRAMPNPFSRQRLPVPLVELGFCDLPPAGYLPILDNPEDEVGVLLGTELDLRFCACGQDDIAQAVQEAQHRDRISLASDAGVDILMPADETGERDRWIGGWVAFVRRPDNECSCQEDRGAR